MRQLHILFNSAKTWHVIVFWFLSFAPNLPELSLKLFWTSEQNNFGFSSGKFGAKHRNQQTITCQVLAESNKIWSCLIFIKLYKDNFLIGTLSEKKIKFFQTSLNNKNYIILSYYKLVLRNQFSTSSTKKTTTGAQSLLS